MLGFRKLVAASALTAVLSVGSATGAWARDHHGHHGRGHDDDRQVFIWNGNGYGVDRHDEGRYYGRGHYKRHHGHHDNIYIVKRRHIPYRFDHHYPVFSAYPQVQVDCVGSQPILNSVIGGVAGGLIGNQFGKGRGRTVTTVGGVILGSAIANSLTLADRNCASQALEYAVPGTQVSWRNPDGNAYTVLPTNNYQNQDGRYCREYHSISNIGGQQQETFGTACRQADGAWQIISAQ